MKESDIRPQDLFNRYLELVRRDNETLLADRSGFIEIDCPACDGSEIERRFAKDGFEYNECADCHSLYQSPRPDEDTLTRFYKEAESVKFWGTEFYRQTAEARREKLIKPRAHEIVVLADRYLPKGVKARFCDIGAGYGTLLEEVKAVNRFTEVTGIEPAQTLARLCRAKGFDIVESTVEGLPETVTSADLLTAFEVIEHVAYPLAFLLGVGRLISDSGVVLLTTLTADGFDIQTLWKHAKAVYPPHHINLMSVEGYRQLLDRAGFQILELSTPGELDVDIVRNTITEFPDIEVTPFIRRLVTSTDEKACARFQKFLSANLMSSHIRIVAKKKEVT